MTALFSEGRELNTDPTKQPSEQHVVVLYNLVWGGTRVLGNPRQSFEVCPHDMVTGRLQHLSFFCDGLEQRHSGLDHVSPPIDERVPVAVLVELPRDLGTTAAATARCTFKIEDLSLGPGKVDSIVPDVGCRFKGSRNLRSGGTLPKNRGALDVAAAVMPRGPAALRREGVGGGMVTDAMLKGHGYSHDRSSQGWRHIENRTPSEYEAGMRR